MNKIVVISGASAGIGYHTAKLFQKMGATVYNLSRRGTEDVTHVKTDVSDNEQVKKAIDEIILKEGRIDILINNAGYGISGSVENSEILNTKKLFDVNFFGTLYLIQAVVPIMRKIGGGMIINVSSAAAKLSLPFQAFYSASKSAVCSLSNALRSELRPFNIKVAAVLPGDVKTDFVRVKNEIDDPEYGDRVKRSIAVMERDEQNGMSPDVIARQIVKLSNKRNPPPTVIGGKKYAILLLIAKLLPERLVVYIMGLLYG